MNNDQQKIKLEQYRNILGYLQYENRSYWTRSGFMTVAQTTLFGFISQQLPLLQEDKSWFNITIVGFSCILGFYLTSLWRTINKGGKWWIERWHSILLKLEPDAYEDIEIFRGVVGNAFLDNIVINYWLLLLEKNSLAGIIFINDSLKNKRETDNRHSVRRVVEKVANIFFLIWLLSFAYTVTILLIKVNFFEQLFFLILLFYQNLIKSFIGEFSENIQHLIDS